MTAAPKCTTNRYFEHLVLSQWQHRRAHHRHSAVSKTGRKNILVASFASYIISKHAQRLVPGTTGMSLCYFSVGGGISDAHVGWGLQRTCAESAVKGAHYPIIEPHVSSWQHSKSKKHSWGAGWKRFTPWHPQCLIRGLTRFEVSNAGSKFPPMRICSDMHNLNIVHNIIMFEKRVTASRATVQVWGDAMHQYINDIYQLNR